jgi:hypothetical protein
MKVKFFTKKNLEGQNQGLDKRPIWLNRFGKKVKKKSEWDEKI